MYGSRFGSLHAPCVSAQPMPPPAFLPLHLVPDNVLSDQLSQDVTMRELDQRSMGGLDSKFYKVLKKQPNYPSIILSNIANIASYQILHQVSYQISHQASHQTINEPIKHLVKYLIRHPIKHPIKHSLESIPPSHDMMG